MKAWRIKEAGVLEQYETRLRRSSGQIKVRLSAVALSETDLMFYKGVKGAQYPIIPAHSAAGFISEADEDSGFKLGTRVVVSPFLNGRNPKNNGAPYCEGIFGIDRDGFLSDFIVVPEDNVYALPEGVTADEAVFVDYIALGNEVFESFDFKKGDYILIAGASTFSIIVAQLAIYYQMVPILVDDRSDKLSLAEDLGVYYTINYEKEDLPKRLNEITGGRLCDFAILEPRDIPFSIVLENAKEGSTILVAGYYNGNTSFEADMVSILKKEITIRGVANGANQISSAINLLANKVIVTDGLITKKLDFEDVEKAFKEWSEEPRTYGKMVVKFNL